MFKCQPYLFDCKPACEVIAFPASRLIGKARWLVDLRRITSVAAMSIIWDQTIEELEDVMILAKVPAEDRAHQLDSFYHLVKAEIVRVDYEGAAAGTSSVGTDCP